jgi:peptide-methionine (R)-S-oxide reductase
VLVGPDRTVLVDGFDLQPNELPGHVLHHIDLSSPKGNTRMTNPTDHRPSDDEIRSRLTPLQYHVTQEAGTERAFTGEYWDTKDAGVYRCVVCDTELFDSDAKFDSGTGWPSFDREITDGRVTRIEDRGHGMVRTEARCAACDAHLGHVFPDGPTATGERYCMNSASLRLDPAES